MLIKLSSIFLHFFSLPIITMYFRRTGKYLKQGGHQSFLESAPSAPPDSFFSAGAETYYFKFQGGHTLRGGICPPCFDTGGAYAHCAPRLRTPLFNYKKNNNFKLYLLHKKFNHIFHIISLLFHIINNHKILHFTGQVFL